MSLPPRSAKQLAVFQLHSAQERILPNDWVKPKASKSGTKSSKRQESAIHKKQTAHHAADSLSTESKSSALDGAKELSSEAKDVNMPDACTEVPSSKLTADIGDTAAQHKHEQKRKSTSEGSKKGESESNGKKKKKAKKEVKEHTELDYTTAKDAKGADKKDSENKKAKVQHEHKSNEKVKKEKKEEKEVPPKGSAWEYSLRPNCDPVKLARMIQHDRKKKFTYAKTNMFPPGRPSRKRDVDDVNVCCCYIIEGMDPCGDHNCMNRLVFIECDPRFCPCGEQCTNLRFQRSEYAKVMPFRTDNKGWGLRTMEPLKAQQFVFEYCGEVINNEECRVRLEANPDEDNFYYITLDRSECIDASNMGNLARFMNHSCNPNCQTQKWFVDGEQRIGLFAKHDIPAGTELTFDYNFERFGSKKQKCYCSVPNCRGYLGAKPKHLEAEMKKKNGKRKPATVSVGRLKRTKSPAPSLINDVKGKGDLTLLEQNWGLPAPPKKARTNYTVNHMDHVNTLLSPPEQPHPSSPPSSSHLFLRRNVNLLRKVHSQYFKTCVAQAVSGKTKKSKAAIRSPSTITSPILTSPVLSSPQLTLPTSLAASPVLASPSAPSPSVSSPPYMTEIDHDPTNGVSSPVASDDSTAVGNSADAERKEVKAGFAEAQAAKREGPTPISARRRKRKTVVRRSPKILDVLKKMGKVADDFTPGDFVKTLKALVPVPSIDSASSLPLNSPTCTLDNPSDNKTNNV